jgi:hypothetical protein
MSGSTADWRPLHLRESDEVTDDDYPVLVDGVPDWLEASLAGWVESRARDGGASLGLKAERLLRLEWISGYGAETLTQLWDHEPQHQLTVIDFILHDLGEQYESRGEDGAARRRLQIETVLGSLSTMLTEGGSLWRVTTEPHWGLVRRVTEAGEQQLASVVDSGSDASKRLSAAWKACYGQNPNYDDAYRNAVLAVEAAVLPETIPNDASGTLGKALAHIRQTVSEWSVGGLGDDKLGSGEVLVSMLALLWTNQQRHASASGQIRGVGRAEAQTAVGLAVTLVQWFTSGLVEQTTKT